MMLGDIMELREYVEDANKEQLEALATFAKWLSEKQPKLCTCSVKCYESCQLVKEMQEAFQLASERLNGAQ